MKLTKADRLRHVLQMQANFALEGLVPDQTDLKMQADYVLGHVSLRDMLSYAYAFAAAAKANEIDTLRRE